MYGTDFEKGFLSSFGSSVVSLATADFQALIGKQGFKEGGFEYAFLHGVVGCVAAELSSANCASGAIGGIAQSIYAGNTGILERHINKDKHLANVEMVSAFAAYFTSQGKGENVSIGASIGRSGFENNALCAGLCILAAIAAGYILGTGEGNPMEGLRRIGRGEDLFSELAGLVGEEALEFATNNFPEQTATIINAMITAGEVANVVIQWTDEATGQVVSATWNDIPQSTRDAIVGGTKVATFLIPAGAAGRILRRVPDRVVNAPINPQKLVRIIANPGTAQSRVNLAHVTMDNGKVRGLDYALERHGMDAISASNSKSMFSIPDAEVRALLQNVDVVQSPVYNVRHPVTGVVDRNKFGRQVDLGRTIGTTLENGIMTNTSIISIITNRQGNIINVFPGSL